MREPKCFGPETRRAFGRVIATAIPFKTASAADALVLEVGTRAPAQDVTTYPGIDLLAPAGSVPANFTHLDGTPYANVTRSRR